MAETMPLLRDSLSTHLSLEAALARLAADVRVDGLALFGSRTAGRAGPASDYDLLILVTALPVNIFQMLSHIDGRMTDIVFVLTAQADRLLTDPGLVATNTQDGRFLLKMQTAEIVYDASGRLAGAQALAQRGGRQAPAAPAGTHGAWFFLNHGLFHIKRMLRANDRVYDTAVDLMLYGSLHDIPRVYCQLREVPWEGEKAAVRYLQQHDAAYLARLRECLAASERTRKVELFEQLVIETLRPVGEIWQPGCTAVALDGPLSDSAQAQSALDFWQSLFRAPAG